MREIFVYAVDVKRLDADDARWLHVVSDVRARHIREYRQASDRRRSLGAELALDAALRAHMPGYQPPPKYRYLENGKPELLPGAPCISLAHAGDFAICAISDLPVGVDIEERDRKSPMPVREWVGVESYLKMTGEGLSGSFRALCAGEDEIFLLGHHAAYLARAELGNCLLCIASDEPARLTVVEAAFSENFS
jgi:phosphopantetheinyl transferase